MSDAELLLASRSTESEERREQWGCTLLLAISAGLTYWAFYANLRESHAELDWGLPNWLLALALMIFPGPIVIGFIAILVCGLFEGRKGPREAYRTELANRHLCVGIDALAENSRALLPGAEAVFLFFARWLPHGGMSGARVVVNADGRSGTIECGHLNNRGFTSTREGIAQRCTGDLSDEELEELRTLLSSLTPGSLKSIGSGVRDGAPCNVMVLTPTAEWRGSCNLCAYWNEATDIPTVQLGQLLAEISWQHLRNGAPDERHPRASRRSGAPATNRE